MNGPALQPPSAPAPAPALAQVPVLGVREMRARFGLAPRRARALMRRMRHVETSGLLYTTEGWLAEWLAAAALPGREWPALDRDREPIDADVVARAIELVGMLADRGAVRVTNLNLLQHG